MLFGLSELVGVSRARLLSPPNHLTNSWVVFEMGSARKTKKPGGSFEQKAKQKNKSQRDRGVGNKISFHFAYEPQQGIVSPSFRIEG